MVLVEGGRFMMGNNNGEDDEKPEHEVKLSPYYIGKFEISQTQWVAIMGNNPSYFKDCDQCPVENVSWLDVDEFIKKINKQTGKNYRLPTEAEWEFAARGGNITKGCLYSGGNDLGNLAWYTDNCGGMTHSAGSKKPNELGVFDMSGNVWEWCNDWYGPYSGTSSLDPQGISSGHAHVIRGGGWNMDLSHCRVSTRDWNYPDLKNSIIGFRLASSKDR
jgi:formylglycine-generating enzyme required for sulfatase activity